MAIWRGPFLRWRQRHRQRDARGRRITTHGDVMRFTRVPGRSSPILLAIVMLFAIPAAPASADTGLIRPDEGVVAYLAAHPGGRLISGNDISYGDGAFIVTVNPPAGAVAGVPDCPAGWFCFYEY